MDTHPAPPATPPSRNQLVFQCGRCGKTGHIDRYCTSGPYPECPECNGTGVVMGDGEGESVCGYCEMAVYAAARTGVKPSLNKPVAPPATEEDLDGIRKRCDAATPGPWEHYSAPHTNEVRIDRTHPVAAWMGFDGTQNAKANARFIAHARSDIPALLSLVERLQTESDQIERTLESAEIPGEDVEGQTLSLEDRVDLLSDARNTAEYAVAQLQAQLAAMRPVVDGVELCARHLKEDGYLAIVNAFDLYRASRITDNPTNEKS